MSIEIECFMWNNFNWIIFIAKIDTGVNFFLWWQLNCKCKFGSLRICNFKECYVLSLRIKFYIDGIVILKVEVFKRNVIFFLSAAPTVTIGWYKIRSVAQIITIELKLFFSHFVLECDTQSNPVVEMSNFDCPSRLSV